MGVFDVLGMATGQAFQRETVVAWMSSARIHPVRQRQQTSTSERCLLCRPPPAAPTTKDCLHRRHSPASSVCYMKVLLGSLTSLSTHILSSRQTKHRPSRRKTRGTMHR
ncbi:unnamed protein product [Ectocarpus fasciculatus]